MQSTSWASEDTRKWQWTRLNYIFAATGSSSSLGQWPVYRRQITFRSNKEMWSTFWSVFLRKKLHFLSSFLFLFHFYSTLYSTLKKWFVFFFFFKSWDIFCWLPKSLWTSPYNLEFPLQGETPQRLAETFDANCYTTGSLLQPVSKEAISIWKESGILAHFIVDKKSASSVLECATLPPHLSLVLFDLFKFSRWWRWYFFNA